MGAQKFYWRNIFKGRKNLLYFGIVIIVSSSLLFYRLDEKLISNCDEVVTTYFVGHILNTGDLLSTVNYGDQKFGTIRPPLFLWTESLAVKIGGYNEFSFRVVSALCGLITILMVYFFVFANTNNPFAAFCCAMVLITSQGFINHHVTRTADYDAMLTMFTTAYLFSFYNYLKTSRTLYILAFAVFLSLAYLTKSTASLLFLPSLIVLYLYEKGFSFRSLATLLTCFLIFACLVTPFYIIKESRAPGFAAYAFNTEILGKFFPGEGKRDSHWTSLKELFINGRFQPWILVLPLVIYFSFKRRLEERMLVNFFLINALSFLFIISLSGTQFSWYLAAFYPVASVAVGITISNIVRSDQRFQTIAYLIFAVFTFGMVYKLFIRKTEDVPTYIKKELRNPKTGNIVYINPAGSYTELFYLRVQESKGAAVRTGSVFSCKPGDIMFCDTVTLKHLNESLPAGVEEIGRWNQHVFIRCQ